MSFFNDLRRLRSIVRAACVASAALLALLSVAQAAEQFRGDLHPGDEAESVLLADEVHVYTLDLVAGASTRVRLRFDEADDDSDEDDEIGKRDSILGTLSVSDPEGVVVGQQTGNRPDVSFEPAVNGVYRVRVQASPAPVEYELEVEVEDAGGRSRSTVTTAGAPIDVPVAAPVGASVRLDVRRRDGAAPRVLSIRDGTGRELGFDVRKARRKLIRLRPVPVTSSGGLVVRIQGEGGAPGTYRVDARVRFEDDDAPDEDDDRDERRVVLELRPGADPQAVAAELGYELVRVRDGFAVFETPDDRAGFEDEDALSATELSDDVLGGEADARLALPEGSQTNGVALGSSLGRTDFDRQKAFQELKLQRTRSRATGAGIRIAVIDTGVDPTHELLAGRVVLGHDHVDDDDLPLDEENGLDEDGDGLIDEGFGHGTFVAGLILGIAPDAELHVIRALDTEGRGQVSWITAAIQEAVDADADLINLSLGMRTRSELLRGAVEYAQSRGVLVVTAAGNGGDTRKIDFPGGVPGVVAVTALDANLRRAPFANAGGRQVFGAPGVDLIGPYPGDRWGTWSGTSFSAALLTGGAALLREVRPAAPTRKLRRLLRRRSRALRRRADRRLIRSGGLDLGRLVR